MGFWGLDHYLSSDTASDIAATVMDAIVEIFKKELPVKRNEWNTDGCINVALILEALILPHPEEYGNHEGIYQLITEVGLPLIDRLEFAQKKVPEDTDGRQEYIDALTRLIEGMLSFLQTVDDDKDEE